MYNKLEVKSLYYLRLVLLYLFLAVIGFVLAWFNAPTWVIVVVFIIAVAAVIYNNVLVMYLSKDAKKIERAMRNQRRNPLFAHVLAVKEGTLEDEMKEIDRIIAKYKQPDLRNSFEFLRSYRLGQYENAIKFAKEIKREPNRSYHLALADVLQKNYKKARTYSFDQAWMTHAVEAEIALQLKNLENYKKHMQLAIDESKGMQLVLNQATFEKELKAFKVGGKK